MKKITIKNIIVLIDIIALIAFSILLVRRYLTNNTEEKKDIIEKYREVLFNNFVILIPKEYNYGYDKNNDDSIIVAEKNNVWYIYVEQIKNTNTKFMDNYKEIQDNLLENGYDVSNAVKTTHNGKDIIVMNYNNNKSDEYYSMIVYSTIDDDYKAEITIHSKEKDKLSECIQIILDIMDTAKKK